MIEIRNLTKFYGKNAAIKNLNFTVNDSEILGFLGPNGAGKSTTMNIITGYLPSTSGSVVIEGLDIAEEPSKVKKMIGFLPEIPPVYMDMKVREYLMFCAGIKGIKGSKKAEQVESAMDKLKIKDVEKRLIKNLSKGYRQRVGFAQAILGNPKYLILDEPTVGLDPSQVVEVRNLIKSLKKDHTIILSSHILAEIQAVCERVVIISHGEVRAVDTIKNLEESIGTALVLVMTVKGSKEKVTECIVNTKGVISVNDVIFVDNDEYTYKVEIENDDIRKNIMTSLIQGDFTIEEISTEKPNLEEVFIKLTSQPPKKKGLEELFKELDENPYNSEEASSAEKEDK